MISIQGIIPRGYRTFPLLFLLVGSLFSLKAQSLNYRQGQLIIQFKPEYGMDSGQKGRFSMRSATIFNQIQTSRRLGNAWNIWLISFDFSKISESKLMNELKELPEVLTAQKNHIIHPRVIPDDPFFDSQWYHFNARNPFIDFDSDKAWDLTTGGNTDAGDSIVICIIDDGIDINHEDLKSNFWINTQEIEGNQLDDDLNGYTDDRLGWNTYKANDQFDIGKHGTPVTGLSGAKGNNSFGIAGICWNVKIMFVEGGGDEANAIESYAYPLQQRRLYNQSKGQSGAFVVATNTSWGADFGRPEDAPLWCAIYDSLGSVGILSVASTANQNIDVDVEGDLPTTCESEFLLAVTSMNDQNLKDKDAAYGKKSIDLGAYGESVYSTFINNAYRSFSGTSAASPQVTGAVALIYSLACSNLSFLAHTAPPEAAREVKRILLQSVRPNATLLNKTVSGGVLNLYQALQITSPLILKEIKEHQLVFEWDPAAIFPIYIRFRIKNQPVWKDTTIYSGTQFLLNNLDDCTEYELQYKNICSRNTDNYSLSRFYKTSGCCEAPTEFKLLKNTGNEIQFSYQAEGDGRLITLLRLAGETNWDTFVIQNTTNLLTLSNLDQCAQYEFASYTYCNNKPTPLSAIITFNTSGCENCSDLDYCKRFRPSSELEWLDAIQIDNDVFKSGNNLGYGNFVGTNQSWTFEKNQSYTFTFQAGYLNDTSIVVVAAWIDYDQNGSFDSNENFAIPTTKFSIAKSYTLSIPANAKSGITRMRLCLKFAEISESTPLACFQSLEFGEYEDYCVNITNEICNDVESVQIKNVTPTQAEIVVSHPTSNSFIYTYRKLFGQNWITGFSDKNSFIINNLDSCSRYELKLVSVCSSDQSNPAFIKFNTPGSGCLVSLKESAKEDLFISPNPFSNSLYLQNPDQQTIENVTIYALDGRMLLKQDLKTNQSIIHIPFDAKPGYYLLRLVLKNGKSLGFQVICQ